MTETVEASTVKKWFPHLSKHRARILTQTWTQTWWLSGWLEEDVQPALIRRLLVRSLSAPVCLDKIPAPNWSPTSPLSICNYHQSFQCMLLLTIIKYNGGVDEIGRTALLFPERRGSDSCQIHGSLFEYDFYTDSSKFSVFSGSPVFKSMYVSEM